MHHRIQVYVNIQFVEFEHLRQTAYLYRKPVYKTLES